MEFVIFLVILGIGFYLIWLSWAQDKGNRSSLEARNNKPLANDSYKQGLSESKDRSMIQSGDESYNQEVSNFERKDDQCAIPDSTDSTEHTDKDFNSLAFSEEEMKQINSKGYELYQQAEREQSAEMFFNAGVAYDRSFKAFWGDNVFGGGSYRDFLANMGVSEILVGEEGVKNLIKDTQRSLVISCECYIKSLSIDLNHYESNLRLATALTVALQVDLALPYWRKLLQMDRSETMKALLADSMGSNHRSTAAKEVIYHLRLGDCPQTLSSSYLEQKLIASQILQSSPYLANKIQGLRH